MDRNILNKYFRDQCSEDELEQVLNWFQTDEGRDFLRQDIDHQNKHFADSGNYFRYPQIESEKIFSRIQLDKNRDGQYIGQFQLRVASILLLVAIFSSLLYWENSPAPGKEKPVYVTYVTDGGQQKIFTLSDGTIIRLNEDSKLIVPDKPLENKREVTLKGEAYFEVVHDSKHPFLVHTMGSTVKVLGTKFNVKADSTTDHVQVAVVEGKVALKSEDPDNNARALLTRNTFGELRLSDSQIIIEKVNVENYLNWINKRLVFNGESLVQVSRQIERIYNIEITFKASHLKDLNLTADIEKTDLEKVLTTITKTFGIDFIKNGDHVIWLE